MSDGRDFDGHDLQHGSSSENRHVSQPQQQLVAEVHRQTGQLYTRFSPLNYPSNSPKLYRAANRRDLSQESERRKSWSYRQHDAERGPLSQAIPEEYYTQQRAQPILEESYTRQRAQPSQLTALTSRNLILHDQLLIQAEESQGSKGNQPSDPYDIVGYVRQDGEAYDHRAMSFHDDGSDHGDTYDDIISECSSALHSAVNLILPHRYLDEAQRALEMTYRAQTEAANLNTMRVPLQRGSYFTERESQRPLREQENEAISGPQAHRPSSLEHVAGNRSNATIPIAITDSSAHNSSSLSAKDIGLVSFYSNHSTPSDGKNQEEGMTSSGDYELESGKDLILERIMVRFYDLLATPAFNKHPENSVPSSTTTPSDFCNQGPGGGDKTGDKASRKRKSGLNPVGNEGNQEKEDDDQKKRQKSSDRNDKRKHHRERLLACPYFKRDRRKYRLLRPCCGPGWPDVSRIKEHLYRHHAKPLHCRRCYATFKDEADLTEHAQSPQSCSRRTENPIDGFDDSQKTKLKARSDMFRAGPGNEEVKWKIVFLILFPSTASSELPSPYYDEEDNMSAGSREEPQPSDLGEFKSYIDRELPRAVRKALEQRIEQIFGPLEETLKNELEGIVRKCLELTKRRYLNTARPSSSFSSSQPGPSNYTCPVLPELRVKECTTEDWNYTQYTDTGPELSTLSDLPFNFSFEDYINIDSTLAPTGFSQQLVPPGESLYNNTPFEYDYPPLPTMGQNDLQNSLGYMLDTETRPTSNSNEISALDDSETLEDQGNRSGKGENKGKERAQTFWTRE